ncbi:MAG: metal ABC transporter permease [Gammaproteobacteria bacterium]|nr:metal ABC transporter permease [Gammaproteobacteria bacterium]
MSSTEISIILPAMLAGLLVLSTHVPLGREVLARGIIFIDLAIAQIAGLGVIIAFAAGIHEGWEVQLAAVCAALTGAVALYWAERLWPDVQEAVIGVVFVVASSASLLLIANHPQGSEHLKDILIGQILWVEYVDLIPIAVLYAAVLLLRSYVISKGSRLTFYLVFAVTITASVQLVGVYLVFASLILPALATIRLTKARLLIAYIIGAAGYLFGLLLAAWVDLPAGPVIIMVMATLTLLALILTRSEKLQISNH